MEGDLAVTLVGLALLDSINTSTLFLVMVILLTARRPIPSGWSYTTGATVAFFGLAVGLYFGASAAAAVFADAATWIRRGTFALLAVFLFSLAYKRLRDRPRKPFALPAWFGPLTALPIGAVATIADLPNAFPLFIAVERIVTSELGPAGATATLAVYTLIYALPTVVLVLVAGVTKDRIRAGMQRITDRFFSGTARRSIPLAVLLGVLGLTSAIVVAYV